MNPFPDPQTRPTSEAEAMAQRAAQGGGKPPKGKPSQRRNAAQLSQLQQQYLATVAKLVPYLHGHLQDALRDNPDWDHNDITNFLRMRMFQQGLP